MDNSHCNDLAALHLLADAAVSRQHHPPPTSSSEIQYQQHLHHEHLHHLYNPAPLAAANPTLLTTSAPATATTTCARPLLPRPQSIAATTAFDSLSNAYIMNNEPPPPPPPCVANAATTPAAAAVAVAPAPTTTATMTHIDSLYWNAHVQSPPPPPPPPASQLAPLYASGTTRAVPNYQIDATVQRQPHEIAFKNYSVVGGRQEQSPRRKRVAQTTRTPTQPTSAISTPTQSILIDTVPSITPLPRARKAGERHACPVKGCNKVSCVQKLQK